MNEERCCNNPKNKTCAHPSPLAASSERVADLYLQSVRVDPMSFMRNVRKNTRGRRIFSRSVMLHRAQSNEYSKSRNGIACFLAEERSTNLKKACASPLEAPGGGKVTSCRYTWHFFFENDGAHLSNPKPSELLLRNAFC